MTAVPVEVEPRETIVRAICHPMHLRNNKPYWHAFWPPPESDEVSVIRHDYLGPHVCKQKGKALTTAEKTYVGLAFFLCIAVRNAGAEVIDSRVVYLGHADIKHRCKAQPKGHPREGAELLALVQCCKSIITKIVYMPDPDPASDEWEPPPFSPILE